MGRITTIATDGTDRVLVSYVAPGDDDRITEAAEHWVDVAARDGRAERYRIEFASGEATLNAAAVRAKASDVRRRRKAEEDARRAAPPN